MAGNGTEKDRDKALDIALGNIEKAYGKGSVMRLGDDSRAPLDVIPTGSIAVSYTHLTLPTICSV